MSQINIDRSSPEEALAVRTNLIQFNAQHIAEDLQQNYEEINLHLKDENGDIAGGINSVFCWNWIEVDILWVDDRSRGRGYGSRLLQEIERIAREKKCTFLSNNNADALLGHRRYVQSLEIHAFDRTAALES